MSAAAPRRPTLGARWRAALRARGAGWAARQLVWTVLALAVAAAALPPALRWAALDADWRVVAENLRLFTLFRYPAEWAWRPAAALALLAGAVGLAAGGGGALGRALGRMMAGALSALIVVPTLAGPLAAGRGSPADLAAAFLPARAALLGCAAALAAGWLAGARRGRPGAGGGRAGRWARTAWLAAVPLALLLLHGAGDVVVPTARWGGLLLTLVLAVVAIGLSFPVGVALALGRRSALPLARWTSVLLIELVRGMPLITILFMASVVVPLVLPDAWRPDTVARAVVGLTLFSAAYVAEDVRGGLAAVGRGQYDAGRALGLGTVALHRHVVLPQALRTVVPAIVGQLISLLKDTSLVLIIGLTELFGVARSVVNQPAFLGRFREALVFAAVVYFLLCTGLSRASRALEAPRGGRT